MEDSPLDLMPLQDYDISRALHYGSLGCVSDAKEMIHHYVECSHGLEATNSEAVY